MLHVIYKEFCCSHVRALFSLLCSLKRFMCALLCTQIEVIITRISFHPIVLCLNVPKINDSEVRLPKFEPTPATWSRQTKHRHASRGLSLLAVGASPLPLHPTPISPNPPCVHLPGSSDACPKCTVGRWQYRDRNTQIFLVIFWLGIAGSCEELWYRIPVRVRWLTICSWHWLGSCLFFS